MALLAKKKKIELKKSLILHIGSDRVTGSLGVFSDSGLPHIISTYEKEAKFGTHESEIGFMKIFRTLVVSVAEHLIKQNNFIPEHVYVSLESPWYTGQTRTIYYSKKEPFTFTEKLAHGLIDEDFDRYKKEAENIFGEHLSMVDKSVIATKLNGYQVESPHGKKAREVTISYYASLAPKIFIEELCLDLEKVLRGKVKFFSSSASLASALYMTPPHHKKLLTISIGGEVTELLYLEDGILVNSGTFPSGRNFLVRTLGNELKQNPLEVFSMLNMCSSGRAHESIARKVEHIIESVSDAWRKELRSGVLEVVGPAHKDIPVLLVGSRDTLPWFKKMVSSEHLTKGLLENNLRTQKWQEIILSDKPIPQLILADCLYIYGINV